MLNKPRHLFKYTLTIIIAFNAAVLAAPAFAQDTPPIAYLRDLIMLPFLVSACPGLVEDENKAATIAILSQGFKSTRDALAARATALHPTNPDAAKMARQWVNSLRQSIELAIAPNPPCSSVQPAMINAAAEFSKSNAFQEELSAYASQKDGFDTPVDHPSSGQRTYAFPSFHRIIEASITNAFAPSSPAKITKIKTKATTQQDASNVPIFVLPPTRHTEIWTASCEGRTIDFTVSFARDSERMIGTYSIANGPNDG